MEKKFHLVTPKPWYFAPTTMVEQVYSLRGETSPRFGFIPRAVAWNTGDQDMNIRFFLGRFVGQTMRVGFDSNLRLTSVTDILED